jgi:hypothetical protein
MPYCSFGEKIDPFFATAFLGIFRVVVFVFLAGVKNPAPDRSFRLDMAKGDQKFPLFTLEKLEL